ncbi:unnamed protein product, partial [Choristocarpus tenellus]
PSLGKNCEPNEEYWITLALCYALALMREAPEGCGVQIGERVWSGRERPYPRQVWRCVKEQLYNGNAVSLRSQAQSGWLLDSTLMKEAKIREINASNCTLIINQLSSKLAKLGLAVSRKLKASLLAGSHGGNEGSVMCHP